MSRRRRAHDERLVEVVITEAGMALLHDTIPIRASIREATGLTAGEVVDLIDRLNALSSRLRAQAAAAGLQE